MKLFYSDSIGKIAEALAKAQGEMSKALTSSTNPHFKSKYADLSACLDAVLPALNKHGIAVTQLPGNTANGFITVTTLLTHPSGEYLGCTAGMTAQKPGPHAHGSALTYLRRYSLAAITGLAQADDDGNQGQAKEPINTAAAEKKLTDAASKGVDALKAAWAKVDAAQRDAIAQGKTQWWEALKAGAEEVDKVEEAA